jgi:hypothetical protein
VDSKKIVISPYSQKLITDKINAKNYPWWSEVVESLKKEGYYIIQIGITGEEPIGADEIKYNLSFKEIKELILQSATWASVDNFLPHFCSFIDKPGVVIWGQSDPVVFGYKKHTNLLKDRKYLRELQFYTWHDVVFTPDCFVSPDVVVKAIKDIAE